MPCFVATSPKDITGQINVCSVQAIAIDTSVYKCFGFRFDHPPLNSIGGFLKNGVSYIIVDVIEKELQHHIIDDANEVMGKFRTCFKKLKQRWEVDLSTVEEFTQNFVANNR